MRPTTTYPSALHLLPEAAANATGHGAALLSAAKTLLDAIGDGLSASHDYQELVGRGLAPDAAAQRIFADHFKSR